jgi:tripartite ATP-independent transporter DctM subunit
MLVLTLLFVGLSVARIPIGLSMIAGGAGYILVKGADTGLVAEQVMNALLQSDVLLAIPMFILCANFIGGGSIGTRLTDLAQLMVGRVRGGLGHVTVLINLVFASMSGSAVADAAGPGAVVVRMMRQAGYPAGFAAALAASAASLAPIIPPSIPLILYAVIANVSVGALFIGGILPGILVAIALMIGVAYKARKRNFPVSDPVPWSQAPRVVGRALLPLGLPVVILGGLRVGAFTPTEGAGIAALYALLLVAAFYREMGPARIYDIFRVSLQQSASIMVIVMGAYLVNYAVAAEQLPNDLARWFTSQEFTATEFLTVVMLLFLVLGGPLETTIMLLVLVPVLLPTARMLGVDMVHFGVVVTVNMVIGMVSPPYGILLAVVAGVSGIPMRDIIRESWFFCGILVVCLAILMYVPEITLFLPRTFGFVN